ncbi:MAG TPA: hypothetical protein VF427_09480 [Noviherbaspirillum sp.]
MADRALLLAALIFSLAASLVAFFIYAFDKAAAHIGTGVASTRHERRLVIVLHCDAPGFLLKRYRT